MENVIEIQKKIEIKKINISEIIELLSVHIVKI